MARSRTSESQMTYTQFLRRFPDNDTCLEYLKDKYYPDGSECPGCGKKTKFFRIKSRAGYSCMYCRKQVYPTAGTIFHKSTLNLQMWFFAIYLMSSTRCGISAKQLEREIGVTYKTAHRMFKQIRTLLSDEGDGPLSGDVEVDETWHGGKPRARERRQKTGRIRNTYRPTVLGMVERGGRVRTRVVGGRSSGAILPTMRQHVLPSSMIFTDEYALYEVAAKEFRGHKRIKHEARIYFDAETGAGTQSIEGFFGLFKNGVRGVYHSISAKYLQNYLDEYAFRYNRRGDSDPMFWAILDRVERRALASPPPLS